MASAEERIRALELELADLERRLPAHTPRPAMIMRLEEIEEELARLRGQGEAE